MTVSKRKNEKENNYKLAELGLDKLYDADYRKAPQNDFGHI